MSKILRVNMSDGKIRPDDIPDELLGLGGRGLSSTLVAREVPPKCDPLGPENKLVFAPGTLTGTTCPNSGRFSVGGKSPLTGGIKESNAGGECPAKLARIGLTALVLEGQAKEGELYLLLLKKDSAELVSANEFKGMRTYELSKSLKEKYGNKAGVICIGPAGEMKLQSASIQVTDMDGNPCRAAGRGGLGALMGSKGVKAIVLDDENGSSPPIVNSDMFKSGQKKLAQAIRNHPATGEAMPALGTTMILGPVNAAGAFPAINAKVGFYEKWEQISGEKLAEVINERGGQTGHIGCTNCIIRCSNVFVDKKKKYVTASLEYETIYAVGAMCDIVDLDTIAKLDHLCDDLGVDTINTGVAIAVAMEAGLKEFGDGVGALELMEEIGKGSEIGKLIGNGPVAIGEKNGVKRIPAVRNQAVPAYDPRGIQGIGVTYATSNMGADHTDAWVIGANLEAMGGELNPLSPDGQVEVFKEIQLQTAAADSTGLCNFVNFPVADDPVGGEGLMELVNGKYGTNLGPDDVAELGKKIVKIEREFNLAAGWAKADNRLPEFYYKEPLPPNNKTFLVSDEDLDTVYDN